MNNTELNRVIQGKAESRYPELIATNREGQRKQRRNQKIFLDGAKWAIESQPLLQAAGLVKAELTGINENYKHALELIVNSPIPANESEYVIWHNIARETAAMYLLTNTPPVNDKPIKD